MADVPALSTIFIEKYFCKHGDLVNFLYITSVKYLYILKRAAGTYIKLILQNHENHDKVLNGDINVKQTRRNTSTYNAHY